MVTYVFLVCGQKDAGTLCTSQVAKCSTASNLRSKAESSIIVHVSNNATSISALRFNQAENIKPDNRFGHMKIRYLIHLELMSKPTGIMPTSGAFGIHFEVLINNTQMCNIWQRMR